MSTMANTTKLRRPRRRFPEEFRAGAVRLVLDEGKTAGQVARELDLTEVHPAIIFDPTDGYGDGTMS